MCFRSSRRRGRFVAVVSAGVLWLSLSIDLWAKDENAIFNENIRQVVHIDTINQLTGIQERGTGVFISGNGVILTALHVVGKKKEEEGRTVTVTAITKDIPVPLKAEVTATLPELDLALLLVTAREAPFADMSTDELSGTPALTVIVWGEEKPDWRSGKYKDTDGNRDVLRIGTAAIPGNSGAPIYNANGQLVAILTNKKDDELSLATPLSSQRVKVFLGSYLKEQRQLCQKAQLSLLRLPLLLSDEKAVTCKRGNEKESDIAKIESPPGYALSGLAEHIDDVNEHGWIWSAEYEKNFNGMISSVSVKLSCSVPEGSDEKGYARTILRANARRIVTKKDESEIELACSKS